MSWDQVLARAAVTPAARAALPAVNHLLLYSVAARYEPSHVEDVFDTEMWRVPYLTAVEQSLWAGQLHDGELAAARAVLAVLPALMDRFRSILAGAYVPPEDVKAALNELVQRSDRTLQPEDHKAAPHCPRCGSCDVDTHFSSSTGVRAYEASCEACGYYAAWREDEQPVHPWGTVP